jgi:DnaJ-domain-containing protein 1
VPTSDQIAGLGARTDRPTLNLRADLSQVQLTPTEGFILSRIDGRVSYDEICRMSSLGREETLAILRALKQQKLILGPDKATTAHDPTARSGRHPPSPDRAPHTPAPVLVTDEMLLKAQEKASGKREKESEIQSVLERLDDGAPVDSAALAEGRDLSEAMKIRILRLYRRLRKLEPHELLGVSPDADTATIKQAFAAASKELHPDRYFGKDLGSYRDKLAKIFSRITEAVQALHKANKAKK